MFGVPRSGFTAALLVCFLAAGLQAAAQEEGPEQQKAEPPDSLKAPDEQPCRDPQGRPESWLDRTHSFLSRKLCEPAAWFDGFFGDARAYEETPIGSFFRVRNSLVWDQSRDFGHDIQVSANIHLPQLSDRVRLLVSRDETLDGEVGVGDISRDPDDEGQTRLGLRLLLSDLGRTQFDVDGTVKVTGSGLNPRARGRVRHTRALTETTLTRWTQSVFWEREDGFGTSSRADWEWLPNQLTLVRLTGRGTVSEASDGIDWRTGLIGFRQLNRKSAIRSEIGAFGYTDPGLEAEEWFVNVRYRRSFLRDWLFYELQPEHAWPIDETTGRRRSDWRFIFTIEVQFENPAIDRQRVDHYRGR